MRIKDSISCLAQFAAAVFGDETLFRKTQNQSSCFFCQFSQWFIFPSSLLRVSPIHTSDLTFLTSRFAFSWVSAFCTEFRGVTQNPAIFRGSDDDIKFPCKCNSQAPHVSPGGNERNLHKEDAREEIRLHPQISERSKHRLLIVRRHKCIVKTTLNCLWGKVRDKSSFVCGFLTWQRGRKAWRQNLRISCQVPYFLLVILMPYKSQQR